MAEPIPRPITIRREGDLLVVRDRSRVGVRLSGDPSLVRETREDPDGGETHVLRRRAPDDPAQSNS